MRIVRPLSGMFCSTAVAAVMILSAGETAAEGGRIDFPLVRDGRAVAQVVVAGDNKDLLAAVEDLRHYVHEITGAELNVTRGADDLPGPTLHLGETTLAARVADELSRIELDGYALAGFGEDVLLAGKMPQGTANGITTVLQDQFGVRWYHAGPLWEVVPRRRSLTISFEPHHGRVYIENPAMQGRTLWGKPESRDFGRHMRLTLPGVKLPYVGAGHSLSHVVPVSKYGKLHPEYFCLMDGKRVLENSPHPCFTHPDMFDLFMEYVRGGGSDFGVNDNRSACQCERCRAIDGKAKPYLGIPNFSESYCQLIARVAAQTAKEFPGRRLGIFAYQQTSAAPQTVPYLGDNVDVVLCQDTAQHFDPEIQRLDFKYAAQWAEKAGGVRFYGYLGINYWTPRYFPTLLAEHMKHLTDVGLKGWGTHSSTMIDSSMPMFYLMYQMLWNADIDHRELIGRMMTDLYGPAARPMSQFYDHWEQCWNRQKTGRWFWGMDNFRGEMEIYTKADIQRGRQLLDEAAALAGDGIVRERIRWISDRYSWTEHAVQAHFATMRAIQAPPPERPEDALALSRSATEAWQALAEELPRAQKRSGIVPAGWLDKTFRVRAWGLKRQARDAALAPLVRWAVAHERELAPERLRAIEEQFAEAAIAARKIIDEQMSEQIEAQRRLPRADGLRVSNIPRVDRPIPLTGEQADWPGISRVDELPWIFHVRPENATLGKYEEPIPENIVAPPAADDQSMTWQAAWDDQRLYLRIVARDDRHVQNQPAPAMWKEDSVQIALNPDRSRFTIRGASWDYLWGGYQGDEVEFGISLRDGKTQVSVFHQPNEVEDAARLINAVAVRNGTQTVYEASVDWKLLRGFEPEARRSLGISLVVNDVDGGPRRSAEYGSGVIQAKRSTEFAAVRLAE